MEHHPSAVPQCLAKGCLQQSLFNKLIFDCVVVVVVDVVFGVVCSNLSSKNEYLIVCLLATIFTGFFHTGGLMEVSMENQILID